MTKATAFLKALEAAGHGGVASVDDFRQRQKSDWLADLVDLRASIRQWLSPLIEARFAIVGDLDFSTQEPDLGHYMAPGLEIGLLVADEPRTVTVRPRGARVAGVVQSGGTRAIGARGRVDIECGVAREILLRFKDDSTTKWVSFSSGEKKALDEELFFDLLARVSDIKLV